MRRRLPRSIHLVVVSLLVATGVGVAASAWTLRRSLDPHGLPYPAPDRLVTLIAGSKSWSVPMFDAVTASASIFDAAALIQERAAILRDVGPARVVRLETVSPAYFDLLGVRAIAGRLLAADDDRAGRSVPVAMISESLWRSRFGSDPAAIGRSMAIDERAVRVVGVLPRGFRGLIGRTDVWVTVATGRWIDGETGPIRPWSRSYELLARLDARVARVEANERFATEARAALMQLPDASRALGPAARFRLVGLAEARVTPVMRQAATVLSWAAVAAVLFIAINVISLCLLRAEHRGRELAIRVAIGADRWHLLRMASGEATIAAAGATVGAIALRPLFLTALTALRPPSTSFGIVTADLAATGALAIDLPMLALMAAMACLGVTPMIVTTMMSARHGGGWGRAPAARRLSSSAATSFPALTLIGVQAGLACAVLVGAALMARTTGALFAASRGYDWSNVVTARFELPDTRYDRAGASGFIDRLLTSLNDVPGIDRVSVSNCAPGAGRCRQSNLMRVDGRAFAPHDQPMVGVHFVTPGHFDTIGASVTRGRAIATADRTGAPLTAVVTDSLAARLWPGVDPIGRSIEIYTANGSLAGERTVVGTIRPIVFTADADSGDDVFLPAAQTAWASTVLFVKSGLPLGDVTRAVGAAVAAIDADVPVHDVERLESQLGRSVGVELLVLRALVAFGLAGLALAAIGAYVTVAQALARSRRELGIRIALGATPSNVWFLVSRRGLVVAIVAVLAGVAGAALSTRALVALLHGLSPYDPVAFVAAPAATLIGIVAAVARPAWQASRVDPQVCLRDAP
jgi:predicted permease